MISEKDEYGSISATYLPFAERAVKPYRCNLQNIFLHSAEMERYDRLKRARQRRFKTAREASLYLRIPYGTLTGHEAGNRGIKDPELKRYAGAYRVNLAWLAHEVGPELPGQDGKRLVPIVGYVGAGEAVFAFDDSGMGAGIDEPVEVPSDIEDDAVGVIVRGASMFPAYWDGDVLIYRRDWSFIRDICLYNECIVKIHEGPTYVKRIMPGSRDGLYTLVSYNAADIIDVPIEWAAPVMIHDKRRRRAKPPVAA